MEVTKQPRGKYRLRFGNLIFDLTEEDRRNLQWCIECALNPFPLTGDAWRTSTGKVFVELTDDHIRFGAGPLQGDEIVDGEILKKTVVAAGQRLTFPADPTI
jgi:hypothetical protein